MAKNEKTLNDLFEDTLKDVYYAENKILKALPKMAKAAHSEELRSAFQKHFKETEGQVSRLKKVFGLVDLTPKGKKCEAIEGILDEGAEIMKEFKGAPALDAGLVSSAQAVEHYEIARYGTLKRWADQLGLDEATKLLDATLSEERKTDEALTELAETMINEQAKAAAE
jgi:ferritin-like metal-binding protein YciE